MTVRVAYDVPAELEEEEARAAALAAFARGGRADFDLTLVFVADSTLAELHGRFLDDDSPTDVMAFDLSTGEEIEFEIYVSADRARQVAAARGVDVARELALYVVHGALHLCGYDDHDEAERAAMREAEVDVLARLGYPEDEAPHEFVGE